jgi:ABC-type multidrug transport system ATPase subunit
LDDLIQIKGLRKVYNGKKLAVKDLWFGVKKGECFGFLGVNGAGKTTTLEILSGDLYPTSGTAELGGLDVLQDMIKVRKLIGYCPQFDSLFETLTAREHLQYYARLKGVDPKNINFVVNSFVSHLMLEDYADRFAGDFSGGNKRKLSVAIALIGDPQILFLDEPSAGVDPISRRFMWKFISETLEGRSVVLTTHSMEECEALAHRIGIMVDGGLKCLGSAQHLKSKFGKGYQLDLNVDPAHAEFVVTEIPKLISAAALLEQHEGMLKFEVSDCGASLSGLFDTLEHHKHVLHVLEYSVSQPSLDQIFIRFSQK